jgi:hypothetical protein
LPQRRGYPGNFLLMNFHRVYGMTEYARSNYAKLANGEKVTIRGIAPSRQGRLRVHPVRRVRAQVPAEHPHHRPARGGRSDPRLRRAVVYKVGSRRGRGPACSLLRGQAYREAVAGRPASPAEEAPHGASGTIAGSCRLERALAAVLDLAMPTARGAVPSGGHRRPLLHGVDLPAAMWNFSSGTARGWMRSARR